MGPRLAAERRAAGRAVSYFLTHRPGLLLTEIIWTHRGASGSRAARMARPALVPAGTPRSSTPNHDGRQWPQEVELPAVSSCIRASRSGQIGPLRLAPDWRACASWALMFKGLHPARLGHFHPDLTARADPDRQSMARAPPGTDRDALYRAVANIAATCAAIMPDSMHLEFAEAKNPRNRTFQLNKEARRLFDPAKYRRALLADRRDDRCSLTGRMGCGQGAPTAGSRRYSKPRTLKSPVSGGLSPPAYAVATGDLRYVSGRVPR